MKNPNSELIEQIQDKLYKYVTIYDNKKMTRDDLKDFCRLTLEYCKLTRHSDCTLEVPMVKFADLGDKVGASYTRSDNAININEKFFDYIFTGEKKLSDLVSTIGHEMKHYNQNDLMDKYDEMPASEQKKIDENSKISIDAYKNYFELAKEDVKVLHKLLAPYLKENEIPKGYKKIEEFYSDISQISYFTILSEKEAREEGVDFAMKFYKEVSKSKYKISKELLLSEETHLKQEKELDEIDYFSSKSKFNRFSNVYSADEKTILEIVRDVESLNGKLKKFDTESYGYALKFLIKNKTLEQKKSLLKNAIFNGYSRFAGILKESMELDIDFKLNRSNISSFVRDCFTGKEYGDEKKEIAINSYFKDYATLLTQEDFENVIEHTLKKNPYAAKAFITFSSFKNFSIESVEKYQKILTDVENRNEKNERVFFNGLFSQMSMENKINLFKSNKVRPEFMELLVKNMRTDILYCNYREEIEPLLKDYPREESSNPYIRKLFEDARKKQGEQHINPINQNEETSTKQTSVQNTPSKISTKPINTETPTQELPPENLVQLETVIKPVVQKTAVSAPVQNETPKPQNTSSDSTLRKRFDITTDKGMNELLVAYADLNKKYYDNNHKRTPEEIQKRRNLNAQMKRILQKKLKEENEETTGLSLDEYVDTNFSENLIETVAKSKGATLKLFNIMACGVYERSGQRIRLTQKQRNALASVLEKVSEKRLNMDSPEKGIKEDLKQIIEAQMGE